MAAAASSLNLHFNSFKKRALELGCYNTNQSGKGVKKQNPQIPLHEIICEGKYPHYQSFKLKNRLYKEGIKKKNCENCGISHWLDKPLALELHHLDGNRQNHLLNNLKLLCPNCHSQTDTFRSKNRRI
jgi:5-methylcytosine-specific restriction endonuclease McrA